MNFFKSRFALALPLVAIVVLALWSVVLYRADEQTTLANYLYNVGYALPYLFGTLACLLAWKKLGGEGLVAKGFSYLGLSFLFNALGLLLWTYYNIYVGDAQPFPSPADILYFIFTFFTVLAIVAFLKISQILVTKQVFLESLAAFVILSVAIFNFQFATQFSVDTSALEKIVNAGYLLTDALFLTLALVVIRSSGGKLRVSLALLALGYVAQTVGDLLFDVRDAGDTYWNGDISDFAFAVSACLLVFGALFLIREFAAGIPMLTTAKNETSAA